MTFDVIGEDTRRHPDGSVLSSVRWRRFGELDARIQVLKTAPNVIDLELKRLEVATRERLAKLHKTLHGNIQEARQAIQSVLESPLTMPPREDSNGREYSITGRLVLGQALAVDIAPSPDQTRELRVAENSRPQGGSERLDLRRTGPRNPRPGLSVIDSVDDVWPIATMALAV